MRVQLIVDRSKKAWSWLLRGALLVWLAQPLQALAVTFPQLGGTSVGYTGLQYGLLDTLRRYIGQGGIIIGLVLGVVAFIWVGYSALTKFNEARQGRAEWSELAVLAIAGAIILIFVAILLTQTTGLGTALVS